MQENLLWANFLCLPWDQSHRSAPEGGRVGPPGQVRFWLGLQFLTKMCPNHVFLDALSNANIPD